MDSNLNTESFLNSLYYILRATISALFFISCTSAHANSDIKSLEVLHISSYQRGYSWTDDIERGIHDALSTHESHIRLTTEYLDSRHITYKDRLPFLKESLGLKYKIQPPDVIIVSDNAALDFIKSNYPDTLSESPIVFLGINEAKDTDYSGLKKVTGVSESVDIEGNISLALSIHPQAENIVFITSTQEKTFARVASRVNKEAPNLVPADKKLIIAENYNLAELRSLFDKLGEKTVVLIAGRIAETITTRSLGALENSKVIIKNSPLPMYTFWEFMIGQGVVGGSVINGYEHGKSAGTIAVKVISGSPIDSIPRQISSPSSVYLDHDVMTRHDVSSENVSRPYTLVNPPPPSIWVTYRYHVIIALLIIIVLTAACIVLFWNIRRNITLNNELKSERANLERNVELRTNELVKLNKKLVELSTHDAMTHLYNRAFFDESINKEILAAKRSGKPLSLIMMDVDFFKRFNDLYGHTEGDHCLEKVANALQAVSMRPRDIVARYGGEEFVILLPETDYPSAASIADKAALAIENLGIEHKASDISQYVTISLGFVTIQVQGDSYCEDDIVNLADEQLYRAKTSGRNQVCSSNLYNAEPGMSTS